MDGASIRPDSLEFERLAVVIADLAARGVSIIYISHKMDEVFKVCGRATVMRDGQLVGEVDLRKRPRAGVVAMMVEARACTGCPPPLLRDLRDRPVGE